MTTQGSKASNESSEAKYTECFVAFIDVLGFKSLVTVSQSDPSMVATLISALNRIALDTPQATITKAQRDQNGQIVAYNTWVLQVRPFSDNICLFLPTVTGKLSYLLRSVRYIHDRMLELGVCIRGAITIGGMYWDATWGSTPPPLQKELRDQHFRHFGQQAPQSPAPEEPLDILYEAGISGFPITLGPGLVEAYELESTKAIHPRVIASGTLQQYVRQNGSTPAFPLTSPAPEDSDIPIRTFFRTDTDGLEFLDLLHEKADHQDTERITREVDSGGKTTWRWEHRAISRGDVLSLAKNLADKQLAGVLPEKVRRKYEWLRAYVDQSAVAEKNPDDGLGTSVDGVQEQ